MTVRWNQFITDGIAKALIDLESVHALIRADQGRTTVVFQGGAVVTIDVPFEQVLGAMSDGATVDEVYRDDNGKRIQRV